MVRRPTLHPEAFVDAALSYVDAHGAAGLTARVLGEMLDADPTALYRHFPSMDALHGAVLNRVFGLILEAPIVGTTPRERLRAHVMNAHRLFYAHPNVLRLVPSSSGDLTNGDLITVRGLELIRALGVTGGNLTLCHQMLESYVLGSHLADLGGSPHHLAVRHARRRRLNDPDIDASTRTVDDVERLNIAAFEAGLEALLDRCEAMAKEPSAQ
jgi:AcrR family transcriptional regulator